MSRTENATAGAALNSGHSNALEAFYAAVRDAGASSAVRYFDGCMTYVDLDHASDAVAGTLEAGRVAPGDRAALYLENTPGFVIGLLAVWKLGAVPVPVNPMYRQRELALLFADRSPSALICEDTLFRDVAAGLEELPSLVLTTSARDYQGRDGPRLFPEANASRDKSEFAKLVASGPRLPAHVAARPTTPADVAFLVYTSGTMGLPKGSISTHGAVMHFANTLSAAVGLRPGEPILGLAPLFHITGLICQIVAAFALAAPLVLSGLVPVGRFAG